MKYIDEFRDGDVAQGLASAIRREAKPDRRYHFMEFCGGHTHAISRYGVSDLLPENVKMIHGPGCPVCVLPIGRVDQAIRLALEEGVILCTYGQSPLQLKLAFPYIPASAGREFQILQPTLREANVANESIAMLQGAMERGIQSIKWAFGKTWDQLRNA